MSKPMEILVIDDNVDHLNYLVTLLQRAGHAAMGFTDARAAFRSRGVAAVDLVITDLFMPQMDGFEVLQALRAEYPTVPLIAVSGAGPHREGDWMLSCIKQLGARVTFAKPIEPEELLAAVTTLARRP